MRPGPERADDMDSAFVIELAAEIGDRLRRTALQHAGESTWLGRYDRPDASTRASLIPALRSLDGSVYGGTAGVALFLVELHRLCPLPWLPDLARTALAHAQRVIRESQGPMRGGLHAGTAGVGYASMRAGAILDDAPLSHAGVALLGSSIEACMASGAVDLVGGVAGVVAAAAALPRSSVTRDLVAKGEAALLQAALQTDGEAWSWNLRQPAGKAPQKGILTGLSHGLSGVAVAFLAAHGVTGNDIALRAARGALVSEDRYFLKERGNWCDLRDSDDDSPPATPASRASAPCLEAWCHGAPGIAVARRFARDVLGADDPLVAPLKAAVRTTTRAIHQWRAGGDTSLCHGLFGLTECLGLAAPESTGRHVTHAIARAVRAHAGDASWPSGVVSRGPNPSLLVGLAGVGHQLLRFAAGDRVPSILLPTAMS